MNPPSDSATCQPTAFSAIAPSRAPTAQPGSAPGLAIGPAKTDNTTPVGSQEVSTAEADAWPRPAEEPRSKRGGSHGTKTPEQDQTWLAGDPFGWIGRRIRNRKTGAIFIVRNVFRNGRVELEKSWMTYSSSVQTIRADFETYS